jgi:hypothetical protein
VHCKYWGVEDRSTVYVRSKGVVGEINIDSLHWMMCGSFRVTSNNCTHTRSHMHLTHVQRRTENFITKYRVPDSLFPREKQTPHSS